MLDVQLPAGYVLGPLRLLDIRGVFHIGRDCFPDGSFTYKHFMKAYKKGRDTSFVVRVKNHVVGFIVAFMRDDGGYIAYLGVARENRKQGLGQALVEYVQGIFAARGAPRISLHVRTTEDAAISFYRKLGYVVDVTREGFYVDGGSAYVMRFWFAHKN